MWQSEDYGKYLATSRNRRKSSQFLESPSEIFGFFRKCFEMLLVTYKEIAGSVLVNFGIFVGPWVIYAVSAPHPAPLSRAGP